MLLHWQTVSKQLKMTELAQSYFMQLVFIPTIFSKEQQCCSFRANHCMNLCRIFNRSFYHVLPTSHRYFPCTWKTSEPNHLTMTNPNRTKPVSLFLYSNKQDYGVGMMWFVSRCLHYCHSYSHETKTKIKRGKSTIDIFQIGKCLAVCRLNWLMVKIFSNIYPHVY